MVQGIVPVCRQIDGEFGTVNEIFWQFPDGTKISVNRPYDLVTKFNELLEAWGNINIKAWKGPKIIRDDQ